VELIIGNRLYKVLCTADWHIPFHNKILTNKIIKLIKTERFDEIVLMGDFLDLFSLGSYNENSLGKLRHITLSDEYRAGNYILNAIDSAIGRRRIKKTWLTGNHEDRYFRAVDKGDTAKYGDALQPFWEALRLKERKYKTYLNWKEDSHKLGRHLEAHHGIYTPIHVAKKHVEVFDGSVIVGHAHRSQNFVKEKRAGYSIGGLFDKTSPAFFYMPKQQRTFWSNGLAVVNIDDHGMFHTENITAYNDRFVYNGKLN
jgi:predicted phosphodiesterase